MIFFFKKKWDRPKKDPTMSLELCKNSFKEQHNRLYCKLNS